MSVTTIRPRHTNWLCFLFGHKWEPRKRADLFRCKRCKLYLLK